MQRWERVIFTVGCRDGGIITSRYNLAQSFQRSTQSSFCYRVHYYKTGVNGVVHFAEPVNTYICVRKIIILCFKKTAQCNML